MKRKVQLDQISEGLSSLGFAQILKTFTDILQPVFVGGTSLSSEELLTHLDLVPPGDQSGGVTFEYLQQYIMELDESGGLFIVHCLSSEYCIILLWPHSILQEEEAF
ncbi:MAG: hypothetical protein MJE68_27740 [Proteobacteria bacterium]|nr:hypothetical protein [Pseudomonadota bacterium]